MLYTVSLNFQIAQTKAQPSKDDTQEQNAASYYLKEGPTPFIYSGRGGGVGTVDI